MRPPGRIHASACPALILRSGPQGRVSKDEGGH
ncbi:MAG: hypothetical protein QOG74_2107 [Alphaproteobacteria bacterium]|nr:hypothetical protein [Alphaproteobacteria bacterium]